MREVLEGEELFYAEKRNPTRISPEPHVSEYLPS